MSFSTQDQLLVLLSAQSGLTPAAKWSVADHVRQILTNGVSAGGSSANPNVPSNAIDTCDPDTVGASSVTPTTGDSTVVYFTADKNLAATQVTAYSRATAAVTTTLSRIGVYSVDAADAITAALATTTNDTAMYAAANTPYPKALSQTVNFVKGTRYAAIVTILATTMPTYSGLGGIAVLTNRTLRRAGKLTGQTDLPSAFPISSASVGTSANTPLLRFT
jgi:hypothetical protein